MYSLVLLVALAGGEAPGHYFVADPCPCCAWPVFPMGGRVTFFWAGPAGLTEPEEKEWQDYIDALDETDKPDAWYYWTRADKAGKRMLLSQVRTLRADKDRYDARKKEEEQKAKLIEEEARKEAERKKAEDKAIEKKKDDKVIEKKDDKAIEKKKDGK
ncbi:MAG: hypothetical protein U0797_03535 [Gemmataceae bacterium]